MENNIRKDMKMLKKERERYMCLGVLFMFISMVLHGSGISAETLDPKDRTIVKMSSSLSGKITSIRRNPFDVQTSSLWDELEVPESTDYIKIERGKEYWFFEKDKKMEIEQSSYVIKETAKTFAKNMNIGPADALTGFFRMETWGMSFSSTSEEGETSLLIPGSYSSIINIPELQQDKVFLVAILPANYKVRNVAKRLKKGHVINVKGMWFKVSEQEEDRIFSSIPEELEGLKILYITEIDVDLQYTEG